MASWTVVPNLVELKEQLDERFPKRDKRSDGTIGNQSHAAGSSSHNPDKTGKPEHRDGDSKNEVRARDVDKDLKDAETGTTMEHVVQMWVKRLRNGEMWWVRYLIYNKRIWHRSDGFKTRVYKGQNSHTEHCHVNSEFNQKSDDVKNTNWGLKNFRKKTTTPAKPSTPATPKAPKDVAVDGVLGPNTIKLWRYWMKVNVRGEMTEAFVEHLQEFLKAKVDHRLEVDGDFGPKTISALQRYLKVPVDGVISKPKSKTIVALQRRLNEGRF
jgi:hypothetical protein